MAGCRRATIAISCALLLHATSAGAATILLANGSAPPDPANVFDATDGAPNDVLVVRNVGCGTPNAIDPCASPGAPTAVEYAGGGPTNLAVYDTSSALVSAHSASSLGLTINTALPE